MLISQPLSLLINNNPLHLDLSLFSLGYDDLILTQISVQLELNKLRTMVSASVPTSINVDGNAAEEEEEGGEDEEGGEEEEGNKEAGNEDNDDDSNSDHPSQPSDDSRMLLLQKARESQEPV